MKKSSAILLFLVFLFLCISCYNGYKQGEHKGIVLCLGAVLVILLAVNIANVVKKHHIEEMEKIRQSEEKENPYENRSIEEIKDETNLSSLKAAFLFISSKILIHNIHVAPIDRISIDPLLEEAAILVYQTNQCEGSQLQRKFSIGYNRSLQIVNQLEIIGVVGPENDASGTREVLFGKEGNRMIKTVEAFEGLKEYHNKIKKEVEEALRRKELEEEKERIKQEIKENKRRKELREQAMQELQDEGVIEKVHKREPIPQEVQDAVWRRDGGRCVKCGSQENLEFDHIIPFSKGGSNTVRNLQLLCQKCNREKSNHIG